MTEDTFRVGRINCGGCERTIRTLLLEVDGIERVSADYRTNTVVVDFDEQRISRDIVVVQLAQIGYGLKEG